MGARYARAVVGELRQVVRRARERADERFYHRRLREPIDPRLAVFAAYWFRGYSCNPRAIYETARSLVPGFRGVWVVTPGREGGMPPGVEYVLGGSREYYDVIARARTFVNNVNYPNHLVKRPGSVHVMTHHGTPLKHMGLDLRGKDVPDGRIDFDALLRRCARWDFSLAANPFSSQVWERAFPGTYESLEYGYPRNDVLVRAAAADVARIREQLGIRPEQRAVLHAPTHRDDDEYVAPLDVARLAAQLDDDWIVMTRRHHRYQTDSGSRADGRVLDVAAHPSVEELCLAADVLITDYSSIMFDYAVLDRPIVIHAPDWDAYSARRGTYFDLLAEPPGAVARSVDEIPKALRSGAAFGAEATAARARFRERFCSLEDGHAAERVVKRVWDGVV
jgi:CDP-glycerol glycerophosphotransferase